MKQVIAMHGWSGDASAWRPWAYQFKNHGWHWQSGERGYGGASPITPQWQPEATEQSQSRRVVIGHSLGPHLLSSSLLAAATDVVLLASFARFLPEGAQGRALRAGLQGMQERLGTKEESDMLHSFLNRAAQPHSASDLPPSPIQQSLSVDGRQRLQADLKLLINTKGLPDGMPEQARVLIVEADQDAIVVPAARAELIDALQHHLKQTPTQWKLENVGHALVLPDLIKRVRVWIESSP